MPALNFPERSVNDLRWNVRLERGQVIQLFDAPRAIATPIHNEEPLWTHRPDRTGINFGPATTAVISHLVTAHEDLEFLIVLSNLRHRHSGDPWTSRLGGPLLERTEALARPIVVPVGGDICIDVGSHAKGYVEAAVFLRLHTSTIEAVPR